jgi:ribonuclease T1
VLLATLLLAACGSSLSSGGAASTTIAGEEAAWERCVTGTWDRVRPAELPAEARTVLTAIDRGGPFPYGQDDSVFQNREGFLPAHELGYYREYTVPTPGAADRGARRIVAGECGERWYTSDHYRSFVLIEEDP